MIVFECLQTNVRFTRELITVLVIVEYEAWGRSYTNQILAFSVVSK